MIEILKKGYHKDPQIFRVGELPDHAYFIPFESTEKSSNPREESPFFHTLCGDWLFRHYDSQYEVADFFADGADLNGFKSVAVPYKFADNYAYAFVFASVQTKGFRTGNFFYAVAYLRNCKLCNSFIQGYPPECY